MTPQEILALAESIGARLQARDGRIVGSGITPTLALRIKENERELVEHLGGQYRSPWEDLTQGNRKIVRVTGRRTEEWLST